MSVTPEALRAALAAHHTADAACSACGITKQGAYKRPDLRDVLQAHFAAERKPRNAARQLGSHGLALPDATLRRLDALRAEMATRVGPRRASRSAVARALLEAALRGPLPSPHAPDGLVHVLDFGDVWDRVGAALGSDVPTEIAATVRAILATSELPASEKRRA